VGTRSYAVGDARVRRLREAGPAKDGSVPHQQPILGALRGDEQLPVQADGVRVEVIGVDRDVIVNRRHPALPRAPDATVDVAVLIDAPEFVVRRAVRGGVAEQRDDRGIERRAREVYTFGAAAL